MNEEIKNDIDMLQFKQIEYMEELLKEESSKTHFVLDDVGFMRCTITHKEIRYPAVSFGDLDYCPRCGRKLSIV